MTGKPSDPEPAPARPEGSQPEILVSYKPAGRETLEAITGELVPLPVKFEQAAKARRESSSPEITVQEGGIERDTLAAIMAEAGAPTADGPATAPDVAPTAATVTTAVGPSPRAAIPAPNAAVAALEIFEMMTYVVRGGDVARLASEGSRRSFVEEHLFERLNVKSMADVERVDVTPWTVPGTLVVRVWCRTKPLT
jgi:hypothetical protein